jgi:hypothetical protein
MKKVLLIMLFALPLAVSAEPLEFVKADANADAMVDAAEFANSGVEGQKLEELDKDKDGALSKKEYDVVLEEECD